MREAVAVQTVRRLPVIALLVAPAAGFSALAFASGGYYPGATAVAAMVALTGLAAWALVAPNPLAGLGRYATVVLTLLIAFADWTLLSRTWSHSPGRALIEFDRVLLYLAVFALFALAGRTSTRARVLVVMLAGASIVVAVMGLAAWLLPDHFHVAASFERRRMSYPTGYWNTTGLLAALGIVWSLHLASASREHVALRVAGAAAIVPLVAVVGYTASRGAVLAAVVGVVVYVLATRTGGVLIGLLACVPAAVGSSVVVYLTPFVATNELLATPLSQGHRGAVALVVLAGGTALLRWRLVPLDNRYGELRPPVLGRRTRVRAVTAMLVLAVAVLGAATASGRLADAYRTFADSAVSLPPGRSRLTNLSSDGRTQIWRVALKNGFAPDPLRGSGAGTFATLWSRYRPVAADALAAHSLYIGTLGDLGLIGAALLFAALVAIVTALARRTRRPGAEGAAWGGLLAAAAAWLVFAGVDWSWEMPACTLWLFAAGGLAASRAVGDGLVTRRISSLPRARKWAVWALRAGIVGVALALALVPRSLERSDRSLGRAIADLRRGDCAAAQRQAEASHEAVAQRPEPDMVLAYCSARAGHNAAALGHAAAAVRQDPGDWEVHYAQALVQAAAGEQPRAALRAAVVRNPLTRYASNASELLDRAPASDRRRIALRLPLPLAVRLCGGPTRADQAAPCGDPTLPMLGPGPPVKTRRP